MSPEQTKKLFDAFPYLYREVNTEGKKIYRGFSCGQGWFRLIWDLSDAITSECKRLGLPPDHPGYPVVVEMKEKFGGLRILLNYARSDDDEPNVIATRMRVIALIREAEKHSLKTCEGCGAPGTMREGGWWHVYCDKCQTKYINGWRSE